MEIVLIAHAVAATLDDANVIVQDCGVHAVFTHTFPEEPEYEARPLIGCCARGAYDPGRKMRYGTTSTL